MKKCVVWLAVLFLAGAWGFSYEAEKILTLSSDGLETLKVDAGAGSLSVTGREATDDVRVRAEIRVTGIREQDLDRYLEDHMVLTLEKKGGAAVLTAKFRNRGFSLIGRDARIDLEVTLPKRLALDIDDGSGWIEIENIAAPVRMDDGSGDISLKAITGDVRIDDGSGDIRAEDIGGSLDIDDSSGEIEVRDVTGDVLVDDSSGSITILRVGGQVTVSDGSGSIEIDDVGGDVRLRSTGSGGVDVTNVKGRVIK